MTQINFNLVKSSFPVLTLEKLDTHWSRLHAGDREVFPGNENLVLAWLAFHNGEFLKAADMASKEKAGVSLQLKALSTHAHYLENDSDQKIKSYLEVVELADRALVDAQDSLGNIYYQIAYSLGRYGQFISVAKALAEGLAGKVSKALQETIRLQPNHADAHTAMATYQAEIIGKLGKMAAKLTYSVSTDNALSCYQKGIELAPYSVSAKTEFADGLLTMYGRKKVKEATKLYQQAVEHSPIDALEALDSYLAHQELEDA